MIDLDEEIRERAAGDGLFAIAYAMLRVAEGLEHIAEEIEDGSVTIGLGVCSIRAPEAKAP